MLTSIRIQNFRSIRDASVKLGQVNLFIGPNNSGKSNFLKGIEFASHYLVSSSDQNVPTNIYENNLFRKNLNSYIDESDAIKFILDGAIILSNKNRHSKVEVAIYNNADILEHPSIKYHVKVLDIVGGNNPNWAINIISRSLLDLKIYKPDPAKYQSSSPIINAKSPSADCSNLVSFIFFLSQNHKNRFRQLENDLAQCVGDFNSISTPADLNESGMLKLKFFDADDTSYWADEVSEGVLYFLALLCIIYQPDPPQLLLLEEPEKGIHPRRIREVMDFIFELARLRDIQIILTSHSPYVVDHFADIPECISVFDRENGETVIRNAADIIAETNANLKEPIRYSDALGEHWVSGFLGGVPL